MVSITTNMMAANAARHFSRHYTGLSDSVRRLSSGLRVGTAADDAAGLAIRELMRADISALNQGVRNVNDAISLIQTADGALGIIDEKLIRMKELAEQAATGTYNADQRLMIDSEFQAMASEIQRIATATDFNGVKLLCKDTANKFAITTGEGGGTPPAPATPPQLIGASGAILNPDAVTRDAVIRYEEVTTVTPGTPPQLTGAAGSILNPAAVTSDAHISYTVTTETQITGDAEFTATRVNIPDISWDTFATWVLATAEDLPAGWLEKLANIPMHFKYTAAVPSSYWEALGSTLDDVKTALGASSVTLGNSDNTRLELAVQGVPGGNRTLLLAYDGPASYMIGWHMYDLMLTYEAAVTTTTTMEITGGTDVYPNIAYLGSNEWDLDGNGSADVRAAYNSSGGSFGLTAGTAGGSTTTTEITEGADAYPGIAYLGGNLWDLDGDGVEDLRAAYTSSGGRFELRAGTEEIPGDEQADSVSYVTRIHFGTANDSAEDYYDIDDRDCTMEGLGIEGIRVQTQANAQRALTELGGAIIKKDAARAYFGATQNRLENTASNLRIQAENLQAAESRISDADVAWEMTAFVRNQILSQSSVSMLAQANSMPQTLLSLLG